ncbi:MAG: hypothetical protein LBV62_02700 [Rickettsiales bacterium]|jgi:hypothetical protein|nr:hypothetical protein [Rickettsiales bacterium]
MLGRDKNEREKMAVVPGNLYVLQARSDGEFDLVEYISPTPVEVMLSQLVSITKHN